MAILDGLDAIDWESIEHAYGSATDVPPLLRALADGRDLKKTTYELWGNVFHQGTRYEASRHVVPFLYEILRDGEPAPEAAHFILRYLHGLALGYPADVFPTRPRPDAWEESFRGFGDADAKALKAQRPASMEEWDEVMGRANAYWAVQAYLAVEAGLRDALPYVTHEKLSVAEAAIALVADFPRQRDIVVPRLRDAVPLVHTAGGAVLALAQLGEDVAPLIQQGWTEAVDDDSVILRVHLACAAVLAAGADVLQPRVLEVLTAPIGEHGEYESAFANTIGALLAAALLRVPRAHLDDAVRALARAHESAGDLTCLQLSRDMLQLAFPASPPERASALTELQRVALEAVAGSQGWRWGNYANLMSAFRLPRSRDAMRAWLDARDE